MNTADRQIVAEFKRRLKDACVPVSSVLLFGSRARGDARSDSDFDVLVIVERVDRDVRQVISDVAWEISLEFEVLLAPVVLTRERLEGPLLSQSGFVRSIEMEGVVI